MKELEAFAENAIAVNRMILRHLSISEAFQPPSLRLAPASETLSASGSCGSNNGYPTTFQLEDISGRSEEEEEDDTGSNSSPHFILGGDDISDSNNNLDQDHQIPTIVFTRLSPPSCSKLHKRRMMAKQTLKSDNLAKVVRSPSAVF